MKTLSVRFSCMILTALLLLVTACKKDKSATVPTLRGIWTDNLTLKGTSRTIRFSADSVYFTAYSTTSPVVFIVYKPITGTYQVEGNQLTMRFTAGNFTGMTTLPDGFSPSVAAPGLYDLFPDATFSFEDSRLLIRHRSGTGLQSQWVTVTFNRNPSPPTP